MFDVEVAKQVGIIAAILFQNIAYWCQHSRANEKNFYDGRYWTFNTNKAFCELFPYLTSKMIRTALQKLTDAGLLVTGNYNKLAYDRTIWYALSEKGESIFLKGQFDLPLGANGFAANGEPIPDINTYNSTNINTDNLVDFDSFWSAYPRKDGKQDAIKAWKSIKPNKELQDVILNDLKRRVGINGVWYKSERRFIPLPATYLRGKRWEDEQGTGKVHEEPNYDYDPWLDPRRR